MRAPIHAARLHPRLFLGAVTILAGCQAAAPAVTEGIRDLDGVPIYVKTMGRGVPLVIVHGGPALDHTYLLPGLAPLADHYRLILYDQRGGGRSGGALDATNITMANFLADLDALRRTFGLERMHLFGHSFGGYIAMAYATAHPDRIASLILSAPTEPGMRYTAQTNANLRGRQTPEDLAAMTALQETPAFRERAPEAVAEMFRLGFLATFHDRANADRLVLRFTPDGARAAFAVGGLLFGGNPRADIWDDLPRVTAPVLIVQGRSDPTPVEMIDELGAAFPQATVRMLDGAGHFPYVETPDAYLAAIRGFLDSLSSP